MLWIDLIPLLKCWKQDWTVATTWFTSVLLLLCRLIYPGNHIYIGTISYKCVHYIWGSPVSIGWKHSTLCEELEGICQASEGPEVGPDEELRSYDESVFLTSVHLDKALVLIQDKLELDITLSECTSSHHRTFSNYWDCIWTAHTFCSKGRFISRYMVHV